MLKTLYTGADKNFSTAEVQNFISRFNWIRFMEVCESYENPWLLDKEYIAERIASGNFSLRDFKLRKKT